MLLNVTEKRVSSVFKSIPDLKDKFNKKKKKTLVRRLASDANLCHSNVFTVSLTRHSKTLLTSSWTVKNKSSIWLVVWSAARLSSVNGHPEQSSSPESSLPLFQRGGGHRHQLILTDASPFSDSHHPVRAITPRTTFLKRNRSRSRCSSL